MKKFLLTGGAMLALVAGVIAVSAFEAHVINVTATIENATSMNTDPINFGTVFPEEVLVRPATISLSQSFLAEGNVDGVNYVIRQKPKCICSVPVGVTSVMPPVCDQGQYAQVAEDGQGNFICPAGYEKLPLLCPFLSKHPDIIDGNDGSLDAFHGPLTDWTLADTIATQVKGLLSKTAQDESDTWKIDLAVPCFKGQCAQDNVVPAEYQIDQKDEHKLFGCDLWYEVTGINRLPIVD